MFLVAAVFCGFIVHAQDSIRTTLLKEVITSASRYERPVLEVPRSVTVIRQDVIEKSIYNSVGELLGNTSGSYVVGQNQTTGATQALFMRGTASNQVAILVDGTRITDTSTPNGSMDLNELSLTDVERIEIIRGSHSTLYGGAAVGGVINIITKKGKTPGFHGNASVQGGLFGKRSGTTASNLSLRYGFQSGLYLNGSLFHQNANGLNASIDTLSNSSADNDGFEKTDSYVKVGYQKGIVDAFISYKSIDQRSDIDNGIYNDDDNAFLDFERNLVNYQAGVQLTNSLKATLFGSWSNSERLSHNDSSLINDQGDYDATFVMGLYRGNLQTNEIQLTYQKKNFKAVVGGGHYNDEMDFNTYYFSRTPSGNFESVVNYDTIDSSSKTGYVFGQANFTWQHFNLSAGGRWISHSAFGDHWTFEVNPSFYFDDFLVYGSISSGFNAPSLYQLYDPSKSFNAYTTRGNRKLDPEETISLEVGVKKEFSDKGFISLSLYRMNTSDAIEYVYLWDKNVPIDELTFNENRGDLYMNVAKQEVIGAEIDGRVRFGRFHLSGNVTWMDGKITIDADDIDPQQTGGHHVQLYNYGAFVTSDELETDKLARRPQFTSFGKLSFDATKNISTYIRYRHTGSRFDSGYDETLGPYGALSQFRMKQYKLFDLGADWSISDSLSLSLLVENIFNEDYQEIIGFSTRGRSAYLKLNFRW